MTRKRNIKTSFLILLRHLGMLCKRPQQPKKGLRISKSLMPDGTIIIHDKIVESAPENKNDFESQVHIFHEIKKTIPQKENK
jgi:hypothetical protein